MVAFGIDVQLEVCCYVLLFVTVVVVCVDLKVLSFLLFQKINVFVLVFVLVVAKGAFGHLMTASIMCV